MPASLTDTEYFALAGAAFDRIEEQIDRWLQQNVVDIDASRTGGLLELTFPDGSQIIVNTQPPLHELWMACRGGGFHYEYVDGQWHDTRDNSLFWDTLSTHASRQAGATLRF